MPLFDLDIKHDEKYLKKVDIPQYLPSETKPTIKELCSDDKTYKLVEEIKKSNINEEEKQFLIKAAQRHLVFNYSKIADYYAHSDKEMQKLMEKSGLVIIDINDAIANGYVKLNNELKRLIEEANDAK